MLRRAVPLCQMPKRNPHLEITCPLRSPERTLKQVVPSYGHLKNNYTLLWDMEGNDGYIKVVAVMQKFFDQASVVTGVTIQPSIQTMKCLFLLWHRIFSRHTSMSWKTSYYQNTYDMKSDDVDDVEEVKPQLEKLFTELSEARV